MTDPRSPTPKPTAEDAYVRTHMQATEQVDAIYDRLQDMPAPACGHAIHCGHVGDINHVNALLQQISDFLDGRGRSRNARSGVAAGGARRLKMATTANGEPKMTTTKKKQTAKEDDQPEGQGREGQAEGRTRYPRARSSARSRLRWRC